MTTETWRCPKCGLEAQRSVGDLWAFLSFYDSESDAAPELLQSCPRCLFAALRKLAPDMVRVEGEDANG